jgi:hypothetical protein
VKGLNKIYKKKVLIMFIGMLKKLLNKNKCKERWFFSIFYIIKMLYGALAKKKKVEFPKKKNHAHFFHQIELLKKKLQFFCCIYNVFVVRDYEKITLILIHERKIMHINDRPKKKFKILIYFFSGHSAF